MTRKLIVRDEEGYQKELELVDTLEGRETLGVVMAPNRNMSDELKRLNKKVDRWMNAIKSRSLNYEIIRVSFIYYIPQ